jgi:vitamin B12 transporter
LNQFVELLAGADYRQNATSQLYIYLPDYGFPSVPLSADSAKTSQVSAYASLVLKTKKGLNAELGSRWNHHSIYGNNFTYSFNPFYLVNSHYKIFANISSGYRAPSLYQLYSEYGNKKLTPEITASYEAGFQFFSDKVTARVSGFARDGKNVILFYTDPATYASYYINGDKQKDYGVETGATARFTTKLSAVVNYTYVDGKIFTRPSMDKDTSFFNLYKRPKNVLNVSVNYDVTKNIYLSTHLKMVSKSYEPQYQAFPYELKGYYTLDFYGRYKFNNGFKIFADFQNITDQKYFVTRGFMTKEFNLNVGLQVDL